jgi:sigma-B regulation protein RsbU (phosphoserine phosphatase)
VSYANAGHEPPFLQFPCGEIRRLETADLLLGVDEDVSYEEECVSVPKGAKIVLVSDGVTEAFDPDENQFGTDRIVEAIQASKGMSVDDIVRRFVDDLATFRRSQPALDDTTLVVAEVLAEQRELEAHESQRTA